MSTLTGSPPQPALALNALVAALDAGEVDDAAASFTRQACLITPGGTAVHGRGDIGLILTQLIESGVEIEAGQVVTHPAGDVALLSAEWTIRSQAPGGLTTTLYTSPSAVLQRLEDSWKIAVLSPWDAR